MQISSIASYGVARRDWIAARGTLPICLSFSLSESILAKPPVTGYRFWLISRARSALPKAAVKSDIAIDVTLIMAIAAALIFDYYASMRPFSLFRGFILFRRAYMPITGNIYYRPLHYWYYCTSKPPAGAYGHRMSLFRQKTEKATLLSFHRLRPTLARHTASFQYLFISYKASPPRRLSISIRALW